MGITTTTTPTRRESAVAIPHGDLVARIESGDARAEEDFVERFTRAVRVVLRQLLRGSPEADDLFQETFRLALEKIRRGEVRNADKLSSFVVSLARNLAINHFRLHSRRRTEPDSEAVELASWDMPDPLGHLLLGEKAVLVRRLIQGLGTDRDRQVLFRFYIAEDDKESICQDLGLSALHFNRVLHRARQRYKELYERARPSSGRGQ